MLLVSWILVMVLCMIWRLLWWKVVVCLIGESMIFSCVWFSSNVIMFISLLVLCC